MKAWYCPSWNGDWSLEPATGSPGKTFLSVVKPTPAEVKQLELIGPALVERGWISKEKMLSVQRRGRSLFSSKGGVLLDAPLVEVGPLVTSLLQPGPAILTAVRFKDGHTEVSETSKLAAHTEIEVAKKDEPYRSSAAPDAPVKGDAPKSSEPAPKSPEPTEEVKALVKKEDAEVAATVKRPTPCCPDCYVNAIGPATKVLLSFLDEEQHESWRKHRFLVVRGGLSGHRYVIAHRNSPLAAHNRKIAFDLEDQQVMHFHDWTVPPEEEVLAAMLILRHREPWLRNEATTFSLCAFGGRRVRYKNPFGDGGDGVVDSGWTYQVGQGLANVLSGGLAEGAVMALDMFMQPQGVLVNPGGPPVMYSQVNLNSGNGVG
jgi:hypothetical protein